jgi:predicted transcriptional regulator
VLPILRRRARRIYPIFLGRELDDIVYHMKQLLVQLDDRTAELLEAAVPARTRKRSEFIRQAIAKALLELAEHRTRAAYATVPDGKAAFNAAEWADATEALRRPKRRRRS